MHSQFLSFFCFFLLEIGLGLVAFGLGLLFLGIMLFFDTGLLAIGNVRDSTRLLK